MLKNRLEKVCFFYGYPISISKDWNIDNAINTYKQYDIVVFGDGYNNPLHEAYIDTKLIIERLNLENKIKIFGYVPCSHLNKNRKEKLQEIKSKIDSWNSLNIGGIFLDEFGYDYLNTRESQNEIINYCRELNLKVFVNSWNDDWIFSSENIKLDWLPYHNTNPNRAESVLNSEDYFLYENMFWLVENGVQKHSLPEVPNRAYRYFYEKKEEFSNKTYYEKFGTKPISLNGILTLLENTEKYKNMIDIGVYFSKVLNISGVAFANETWGANGKYNNWSFPEIKLETTKLNELKYEIKDKEFIKCKTNIDGEKIEISWGDNDPSMETGERQVLLNGVVVVEDGVKKEKNILRKILKIISNCF